MKAQHAIAAALEMSQVLEEFRKEIPELGEHFDVGMMAAYRAGRGRIHQLASTPRLHGDRRYGKPGVAYQRANQRCFAHSGFRIPTAACGDVYRFIPHGSHTVKGREQPVALLNLKQRSRHEAENSAPCSAVCQRQCVSRTR